MSFVFIIPEARSRIPQEKRLLKSTWCSSSSWGPHGDSDSSLPNPETQHPTPSIPEKRTCQKPLLLAACALGALPLFMFPLRILRQPTSQATSLASAQKTVTAPTPLSSSTGPSLPTDWPGRGLASGLRKCDMLKRSQVVDEQNYLIKCEPSSVPGLLPSGTGDTALWVTHQHHPDRE